LNILQTQTRQRLLTGSIVPVRFQSTISPADSASSFFVHKYDNPDVQQRIAYWLFACCAIVFGIVVLGGVTRLTRSGLSMVDWKPFSILPPTSQAEWDAEFTRYQSFPEYNELGREMSLSEFKFIYFMEFSHRLAGRFLGLFFGIPAVVLGSRGLLSPSLKRRFIVLFALGGLQVRRLS
jgi:cytochrome c oxidase assembly protein subunit 15